MVDVKVSVIVPFYNLEAHASRTIESLLAQTLNACEFVFVNDASSDATLEILLRAADADERVKVVDRKMNGGIAAARNDGIAVANGRYVAFVDGDDIVSPWYLETMYNAADGRDDIMVCAGTKTVKFSDVDNCSWNSPLNEAYVELDAPEIAEQILYKNIGTTAWGKLAPRHIYVEKPFPSGVKREELRSIAGYIGSCSKFRILREPVYGYVMRADSTVWASAPKFNDAKDYLEAIEFSKEELTRFVAPSSNAPRYYDALMKVRLHEYLNRVEGSASETGEMERALHADVRGDLKFVLFDGNARLGNRIRLLLYVLSPNLLDAIYSVYKKRAKGL